MDCSPPDSSVHEILWARILEWVAIPFSRDLPDPGIKPRSPAMQAASLLSEPPGKPKLTVFQLKKKKQQQQLAKQSQLTFQSAVLG